MTGIANLNLNTNALMKQKRSNVFVGQGVNPEFASNAIEQYKRLTQTSNCQKAQNLVILSNPDEIETLGVEFEGLSEYLKGDASIAYGVYSKKDDAICLIQDNHERKEEKYEGNLFEQASDTLTHEFAHLIDEAYSKSKVFCNAYLQDLENFAKNLDKNPDETIGDSNMSYKEAQEYFKHYFEGADFSDGISKKDITRRGARENFAESYSTIYDSNPSEVNSIYAELFSNSVRAVEYLV